MPRRRVMSVSLHVLVVLAGVLLAPVAVSAAEPVTNTSPPALSGTPAYRSTLRTSPGTWDVADPTYSYQWLRDGTPIGGATEGSYRPVLRDIGTRVSVLVTASKEGYADGSATSADVLVRRATLRMTERPAISGIRRYLRTLTASSGDWRPAVDRVKFRWLRNGRAIAGATGRHYRLSHLDVGKRISVRVTATRDGYRTARVNARRTKAIGHRVALRRTVYYHVETRGRITASLADFRRLAHASLNDPRGWRTTGIAFKEVRSGGSMTLVLAEASRVPVFSSVCSSDWSCRVGRYVIINQKRWRFASPAWNRYGGSLRGYRHMVVNHETGHWLGHGHRSCPASGALAPVMQQQSISLGGCRFNPFPTRREWFTPRF